MTAHRSPRTPERRCPFHDCGKGIPASMFACRGHWFSLNAAEKAEIWAAYTLWQNGGITGEDLRERQQAVLGSRGTA